MRFKPLANAIKQAFRYADDYGLMLAAAQILSDWHMYPRGGIRFVEVDGVRAPQKWLCGGDCIAGDQCPHAYIAAL